MTLTTPNPNPLPTPGPQPIPLPFDKTVVHNVELTLRKDVANAEFDIAYDVRWSAFDRENNVEYDERLELIEEDPNRQQHVWSPIFVPLTGVASNGDSTTHVERGPFTMAWSDLDLDPATPGDAGEDEIRAVVTLTPRLPVQVAGQSVVVEVQSP